MSEYNFVEKPFLNQLDNLGWDVINQGAHSIPTDPAKSLRETFFEVVLKDTFYQSLRKINPWLLDTQCEDVLHELINSSSKSLIEANQDITKKLLGGFENKITMPNHQENNSPEPVKLIDFDHSDKNSFIAINQFKINTPGKAKDFIIPDIVLFINGLPIGVIECKYNKDTSADAMADAIDQLQRYANLRSQTRGVSENEGDERLFHFNQFMIATCGDGDNNYNTDTFDDCGAKIGTITSISQTHYLGWKETYPYTKEDIFAPLGKVRDQEVMIQGLLSKKVLLDIIRSFIIFKEEEEKKLIKIICRYQQYRATCKTIERLQNGKTAAKRSGVIWHTQGSGKSLTMVFLVRKMRYIQGLSDYKVLLVNDRTDLEKQLTDTAKLTDEKITVIKSTKSLIKELKKSNSNIYMVMVHKFLEHPEELPEYLADIIKKNNEIDEKDMLKEAKLLGVLNESEKILICQDEAHRSANGFMTLSMFNAFPNAAKIAFTGTPLINVKDERLTIKTFGDYIDKYKLLDAVKDGATLRIIYEGRTQDAAIKDKSEFDDKFEDLFSDKSEEELETIKKKYGTMGNVLEAKEYIKRISNDLVNHYIDNILPNGFKAQVVSISQPAAVRFKKYIDLAIGNRLEEEKVKRAKITRKQNSTITEEERNQLEADFLKIEESIKRISFLKAACVISGQQTNELPEITRERKYAKKVKAIESFKQKFDYSKENTGIAILIVCDMLLTGFDAPVEQIMYIVKRLKEHNLLQAIARVNRTSKGKSVGYIMDYIGFGNHLKDALKIYASDDQDDIINSLPDISSEVPILQDRYQRLLNLFTDSGISKIKDYVEFRIRDPQEQYAVFESIIEKLEGIKMRADFSVYFKNFLQSIDIIYPRQEAVKYVKPVQAFGHILNRAKHRYKDETMSFIGIADKIRGLVDEHLISLGIDPVVPPTELLSKEFKTSLDKNKTKKAKASEMEHAIRKHIKVELGKDPVFYDNMSKKLEKILHEYYEDVDNRYNSLLELFEEIQEGRTDVEEGLDKDNEMPFYDLLKRYAYQDEEQLKKDYEKVIEFIKESIICIRSYVSIKGFWSVPAKRDELEKELSHTILMSGLLPVIEVEDKVITEFIALAKIKQDKLTK
jgi:type I restriction enzyme R subunit